MGIVLLFLIGEKVPFVLFSADIRNAYKNIRADTVCFVCLSADTARVHKTAAKRIFLYFFYRLAFLLTFFAMKKSKRKTYTPKYLRPSSII